MARLRIYKGNAALGEILAFIDAAARAGEAAAVDAERVPVLTRDAKCRPTDLPEGKGLFVFEPPAPRCRGGWVERLAACAALVATAPLWLAVALLILALDGSPALFRQVRHGVGGVSFVMLKFRTMLRRAEDAHERLQRLRGRASHLFKLARDPRVTRLGRFLRRTYLDELPQLVNVARGEMRFVGPRPLPASDQRHYTHAYHALRLKGVPGMTGLWQVSGRNARTFDEMVLLDYYYLCNRSARLDFQILCRTLLLPFKQKNAAGETEDGGQHGGGV